jgi:hypothetical protein
LFAGQRRGRAALNQAADGQAPMSAGGRFSPRRAPSALLLRRTRLPRHGALRNRVLRCTDPATGGSALALLHRSRRSSAPSPLATVSPPPRGSDAQADRVGGRRSGSSSHLRITRTALFAVAGRLCFSLSDGVMRGSPAHILSPPFSPFPFSSAGRVGHGAHGARRRRGAQVSARRCSRSPERSAFLTPLLAAGPCSRRPPAARFVSPCADPGCALE